MAALVTLGLLALPAAGVVFTMTRSDKPHATAERSAKSARREKKPPPARPAQPKAEKAKVERPAPQVEKPKAKPKHHISIAGTRAQGSDLGGKLSWIADQSGAKIKNPCAFAACLDKNDEEKACASGSVVRAKKTTVTKSWGAGIDWNLREDEKGAHALGKTHVKGLSFFLDSRGKNVNFLFGVRVKGVEYCTDLKPGSNRIEWKRLRKGCTEKNVTGDRDLGPLLSSVTSAHWYAQATRSRDQKYEFCVSQMKAL